MLGLRRSKRGAGKRSPSSATGRRGDRRSQLSGPCRGEVRCSRTSPSTMPAEPLRRSRLRVTSTAGWRETARHPSLQRAPFLAPSISFRLMVVRRRRLARRPPVRRLHGRLPRHGRLCPASKAGLIGPTQGSRGGIRSPGRFRVNAAPSGRHRHAGQRDECTRFRPRGARLHRGTARAETTGEAGGYCPVGARHRRVVAHSIELRHRQRLPRPLAAFQSAGRRSGGQPPVAEGMTRRAAGPPWLCWEQGPIPPAGDCRAASGGLELELKVLDKLVDQMGPAGLRFRRWGGPASTCAPRIDAPLGFIIRCRPRWCRAVSRSRRHRHPGARAFALARSGLGAKPASSCSARSSADDHSDDAGEWLVPLVNRNAIGTPPVTINPGERIAQAVFLPIHRPRLRVVQEHSAATAMRQWRSSARRRGVIERSASGGE